MGNIITHNGIYPGTKLEGTERYSTLYHYTSFESFLKIWETRSLKFSNVEDCNDMEEAKYCLEGTNWAQMALFYAFSDLRRNYGQVSLCMDYDSFYRGYASPQMWACYANKAKGVCIKLNFESLDLTDCFYAPIQYKNITDVLKFDGDVLTINDVKKFIEAHKDRVFFTKQFFWENENEFRIVSNRKAYLDISKAIRGIYVTDCDTEECMQIEKMVYPIPVNLVKLHDSDGLIMPISYDTRHYRDQVMRSKYHKLYELEQKIKAYYEENKNNLDIPLLINRNLL
jgi:hypothetical protein